MRKNKKQIAIGLCLLLMSVSFFAYQKQAEVQAEDTSAICYVAVDNLQEYLADNTTITITNKDGSTDTCRTKVPTLEGYVFAGFYAEENETTPISQDSTATSAYAKFVPEEILSVRGQCREAEELAAVTEDGSSCMRFVTAVDSFSYAQIGFKISIGSNYCVHRYSNTVYDTLYGVGETSENGTLDETYKPGTEFHEEAKYFKTWTYTEIPYKNFTTAMTVTPFWITNDGSIVYGTEKAGYYVNQGLGEAYNATQGTYGELTDLISAATAGDEIRVQRDMKLTTSATTSIAKTLTITTDGYERIIECKPTAGKLFTITSGTTTIKGASENAQLIFDGKNHTQPAATIFSNAADCGLNMEYVTMRNINTSVTNSGAIRIGSKVTSTVLINGCIFENCSQGNKGGAIFIQTPLKVTGSTFNNCSPQNAEGELNGTGGAIYSNKAVEVVDSRFEKCSAVAGGAIYIDAAKDLTITSCEFYSNSSTKYGGAVALKHGTTGGKITLLGACTFKNNTAGGSESPYSGGAVYAQNNLIVGNGTDETDVKITENACTAFSYGEAICIDLGTGTSAATLTLEIKDNAVLSVYDNDGDDTNDICSIYGEDIGEEVTLTGATSENYITSNPNVVAE